VTEGYWEIVSDPVPQRSSPPSSIILAPTVAVINDTATESRPDQIMQSISG
jgi:hypothetical protein